MAPRPAAGWVGPAAVVETHISVLTFVGDRVYKLKKPVHFDFLDFRRREQRREACHREVQVNRRLSPDVYLGVLDVVDAEGRLRDHLVEMVRLPPDRRLATLVTDDDPGLAEGLDALARTIADFHADARRGPTLQVDAGHAAATTALERELEELRAGAEGDAPVLDPAVLAEVAGAARRWLAGRAPLFAERASGGHVVDGHGDLQAEDVFCLDDGPRVLDSIEFSDRLRHVDVWDDVAFLVMDLQRLGRADLGEAFADAYRRYSGDRAPASLVAFFAARRALIRAKVLALRARQLDAGTAQAAATEQARALVDLARRDLAAAEVRLVLVGGLPGTGKSTVAEVLSTETDAIVLGSDLTRKERAGIPGDRPAPAGYREGLYDPATTSATYDAMLDRARVALGRGTTVVLDASWSDEAHRRAARRLAAEAEVDLVEVRCVCPAEVAATRIRSRRAAGGGASDADEAVASAMAADTDDWPEALVLDTDAPIDHVVARAVTLVQRGAEVGGSPELRG
ncbi:AAA family ATPase [Rhabdothermincola salaria]|uniref:bifunctional aminoglycoside phosphotransferase/ATP-binding protein n=1 Tax=Rhabdothermincola salaria TaxID=2903142 RepID=UPI001E2C4234|nr:AAA family ATPase [Rhabdothermincola salaria]